MFQYTNSDLKDMRILLEKSPAKNKGLPLKKIILGILAIIVTLIFALSFPLIFNKEKKEYEINTIKNDEEDLSFTEEEHRALSRKFATEGMVLAVNNVLPLEKTDQVVLFGEGTNSTIYGGTGSGEVYTKGTSSNIVPVQILKGIEDKSKEGKILYIENNKGYEIGIKGSTLTERDIEEFAKLKGEAKRSVAIITISRVSGEGSDRPQDQSTRGTLLKDSEKKTYESLIKYFNKVVVILNVGSVIELEDIEKNIKTSILISFLPGMEAGNAIADVLVGDSYPSGHLTDTWAKKIDDYPTTSTFKESKMYVKYKEGLFVGYRYFEDDEIKQDKIVFPFGFGLSYTNFDISSKCIFRNNVFTVSSVVRNVGNRKGKEVVQVYVEKPQNEKFIKTKRELVAFAKTKELIPNEEQTLTMNINLNDLSSYDDTGVTGNKACYVLEKGEYKLYVGTSVADTRKDTSLIYTYNENELKVVEKLNTRLQPKDPDVADANTKPKFNEFMYKDLENKNNNEQVKEEKSKDNFKEKEENANDELETYCDLPISKVNEINFKTVLEGKHTMEQLVDTMTNEELAFLSYGHSGNIKYGTGTIGGHYNSGITGKYLIPSGDTLDGPAGLRQAEVSMQSTAWPCSTALASTFDVDVLRIVGEETGKECRKIGCSFWLAPGMNIHRSPLCGRNFEYYSEDPFLTGKMAAAISKGFQSKRASITLKHFAFNDKEENRNGDDDDKDNIASDSRMAERVAREIYLKGFEIAVKEGKPWSIMTSYNRMNGVKTAENHELITDILRNEWGYDGLVMTDWGSKSKNDREATAGGDVKMPSGSSDDILRGLKSGTVTREELKRNALHIFKTLSRTAAVDPLLKKVDAVNIDKGTTRIKIADHIYDKADGVSYEDCKDEDGGYNPTNTHTNKWITILVNNTLGDVKKNVKIRYSSIYFGFGVIFKKYEQTIGEILNLDITGDWQKWATSPEATILLPNGVYELTIMFVGYDYRNLVEENNKGNINWIEIY